jgi:putative DNA methylase
MLTLLTFSAAIHDLADVFATASPERATGTVTLLAAMVDKLADFDSTQCMWNYTGGRGKTTLGWSTLVDALRRSGCEVVEAWPLDTERGARMIAVGSAALASSIFLIARKRDGANTGSDDQVRPELESIVRERVETLWDMGISGADLVIASVGAGLRAFTRFARVEYANGEEVPAERFLTEVETVVLETILARLSRETEMAAKKRKSRKREEGGEETGSESEEDSFAPSAPFCGQSDPSSAPARGNSYGLAGLDAASRFYVLWRYTYGGAELDAGEVIISPTAPTSNWTASTD